MALVKHTHTAGIGLSPEQIAEVRAAAERPYTYNPDCPLLTEEQLAEFHPVNGMTWEERARAMREVGVADAEDGPAEEPQQQVESAVVG